MCISGTLFDYDTKLKQADEINQKMAASGFWDDGEKAQKLVGELRQLTAALKPLKELISEFDDLGVLLEFAEADETGNSDADFQQVLTAIVPKIEAVELQATMADPSDICGAYVAVQAGEGGTDSADWAEMLLRMYQHGPRRKVMRPSCSKSRPRKRRAFATRRWP